MGEEVDQACDVTCFFDEDSDRVANARKALDAIVETDDLVVHRVCGQGKLVHQVHSRGTDSQSGEQAAFDTHAHRTAIALAAHAMLQAIVTARRESLAAVVFGPVLFQDLAPQAPIGSVGGGDACEQATAGFFAQGIFHADLKALLVERVVWVCLVIPCLGELFPRERLIREATARIAHGDAG